jgi:hypothetical protein
MSHRTLEVDASSFRSAAQLSMLSTVALTTRQSWSSPEARLMSHQCRQPLSVVLGARVLEKPPHKTAVRSRQRIVLHRSPALTARSHSGAQSTRLIANLPAHRCTFTDSAACARANLSFARVLTALARRMIAASTRHPDCA